LTAGTGGRSRNFSRGVRSGASGRRKQWGSESKALSGRRPLQCSPRPPCWNKQYFIRNNYRNARGKAILNL